MKETFKYHVKGVVGYVFEEGYYKAVSAQQACYKFCRSHGLGPADDVPGLSATKVPADVNDKNETFYAKNGGYLDD